MIINDTYGFVFVHIPKCGGSTVKHVIRRYDQTDFPFMGVREHPVAGRLEYAHIPMEILQEHFAEEFSKIERYKAFALVREPRERFFSALSQNQRMFSGTELAAMNSDDIIRECEKICNYLNTLNGFCDPERIHFEKQSRYVEVDGKRIVDVVLPLQRIDLLIAMIGDVFHRKLKIGDPVNQTRMQRFELRKQFAEKNIKIYKKIRHSKILPISLKRMSRKILFTDYDYEKLIPKIPKDLLMFIDQYYSEDAILYQKVMQAQERRASLT